jgi:hypothetical protein
MDFNTRPESQQGKSGGSRREYNHQPGTKHHSGISPQIGRNTMILIELRREVMGYGTDLMKNKSHFKNFLANEPSKRSR